MKESNKAIVRLTPKEAVDLFSTLTICEALLDTLGCKADWVFENLQESIDVIRNKIC